MRSQLDWLVGWLVQHVWEKDDGLEIRRRRRLAWLAGSIVVVVGISHCGAGTLRLGPLRPTLLPGPICRSRPVGPAVVCRSWRSFGPLDSRRLLREKTSS